MGTVGTRSGMRPGAGAPHRTPWLGIAPVAALVGVALAVLSVVLNGDAGEPLLLVAMLALLIAWFTAALGWVRGRGRRFAVLPRTRLGWTSLGLMVLGWLMTWVPGQFEGERSREVDQLLDVVLWGGFAVLFLAGVQTLVAMGRRGERSAPLIVLAAFATLFGPFFVLGEIVAAH